MKNEDIFRPIDFNFDQNIILKDLVKMDLFKKSSITTIAYENGRSIIDTDNFFESYDDVTHYDENGNLIQKKYNTYVIYNFTHLPIVSESENESFVNASSGGYRGKRPIWHVYDTAWSWKENTPQSLIDTVNELDLEYISCVRLVGQIPPSKGIVHADSNFKENLKYFKNGGVSITLNVTHGGGHLQYRYKEKLHTIDESKYKCWHFNDALQHRTTEITSPRVQIRVFGKRKYGNTKYGNY